MFSLPTLPYPLEEGIPPTISAKQLDLHYNKHHNTYVTKLNGFVSADDSLKGKSLEEIVSLSAADPSKKGIFNNAAQHFNHSFYWSCLKPNGSKIPAELEVCIGICPWFRPQSLQAKIKEAFGSVDDFKKKFLESGTTNFGSGWTWLCQNKDGKLEIVNTSNAGVPFTDGYNVLLTCDVWEHAYYVDYLNKRDAYIEAFWNIVNWDFVASNLK